MRQIREFDEDSTINIQTTSGISPSPIETRANEVSPTKNQTKWPMIMNTGAIIFVEDDEDLRKQVVDYLNFSGFNASGAGDAGELYRLMAVETFAILILDYRLPGENGLSIAAHVRAHSATGIIMLTAKNSIEDRLRGHEAGADFYLTKPVDLRELGASVRTLFRRLEITDQKPRWTVDESGFTLFAPNGRSVPLTPNELALLRPLASPSGVVVSRSALLTALGYAPDDIANRNLDAALRRLRLKVRDQTGDALPLRTVHSIGYMIFLEMVMGD